MAYVIAEPCIDAKDCSCQDACPPDCILGDPEDRMLYIDPGGCNDCGACVDACPVDAIYAEEDLPASWVGFVRINSLWFENKDAARAIVDAVRGVQ